MMNTKDKNVLTLAYIGDAIYEVYIRKFLIDQGISKVNSLQKSAINYVSAKNQAKFVTILINDNFFNDIELEIIKRARNHKSRIPKNTDIITYKLSTGFESLLGDLYLNNNERLYEILNLIEVK